MSKKGSVGDLLQRQRAKNRKEMEASNAIQVDLDDPSIQIRPSSSTPSARTNPHDTEDGWRQQILEQREFSGEVPLDQIFRR